MEHFEGGTMRAALSDAIFSARQAHTPVKFIKDGVIRCSQAQKKS
jgi:hypothetical protein